MSKHRCYIQQMGFENIICLSGLMNTQTDVYLQENPTF